MTTPPAPSNACIPPKPISEMTEYEIAWYRSNRERCWDCLCCESTCKCQQAPLAQVISLDGRRRA